MSKNGLLIGLIVLLIVVFGGGGYYFLNLRQSETPEQENIEEEQKVKEIKADDIGLVLSSRADGKAVNMRITKLDGIASLDYEANFDAEVRDPDSGDILTVPRGSGGSVEIKSSDSEIKREVILGTCSSGTCKYDKVVSDVKFIIRVNYSNGEIGSIEESLSL